MTFDEEMHAQRARSFGAAAAEYAAHRPDYPRAAVRWLLEDLGDAPVDVLDLAAGTGKLTDVILAEEHRVAAVEPDESMLDQLSRRLPGVPSLLGNAEQIPLPDGSVDAVLVGQAFHWFHPERAMPEIARVLRPGGVLGALWNDIDTSVAWVAEFQAAGQPMAKHGDLVFDSLPAHPRFTAPDDRVFPHAQRRTAESLVATFNTHSHLLVMTPRERAEANGRMAAVLRSHPETASGEFDLPLVCSVRRLRERTVRS